MLHSNLFDYNDTYMLVKKTILVVALVAGGGNNDKEFLLCYPFIYCVNKINNTQVDNAKDFDVIEFRDNYSKTWASLQQYRGRPFLAARVVIFLMLIMTVLSLKYLSNFWRNFEISLINCTVNLILTWGTKCVLSNSGNQETTFTITETKLYVSVVTLSTQDNAKLLQQLNSGFKRASRWNKYQPEIRMQARSPYLDYFIDPIFRE